MPNNSSALTGSGPGPSIDEIRKWTESLMQQGVDPKTRLNVSTTPYYNQFDAGSWKMEVRWTKE